MTIGQKHREYKKYLIEIFNKYKEDRGTENDGVDIDFLEKRVKSLEEGKYTLAIAGEVKAGKSTFINALLGAELLPTDVLQASSAIVEIFKSEKSYLKIEYADNSIEEVYDDLTTLHIDKAQKRLGEVCSLNDDYRSIPTTVLNEMIIDSDQKIQVDELLIKNLNARAGTNINFSKESDKIKTYISEYSKKNIPVKIEFGYPFKWSFDDFRLVDTPGVNAIGGVQDISYQYLESANAVLFVKPIEQIELESFKKFVKSTISEQRSKESLFLVLTKTGKNYENFERLYEEAVRIYQDIIPRERILAVDSILSLIHTDLKNGLSLEEIEDKEENKRDKPKTQSIPYFEKKARKNNLDLKEYFLNCSGFEKMSEKIDEFSSTAPKLQLKEIIEIIKGGYETLIELHDEKTDRLNKKKRNPQEFEQTIRNVEKALSEHENLLLNAIDEFENKNTLFLSTITNKLKITWEEKIAKSDSIENSRKNLTDALRNVEVEFEKISSNIKLNLNDYFTKLGKDFKTEYKVSLPKVDFNAIENNAQEAAYKDEAIYEERYKERSKIGKAANFITFGLFEKIFPKTLENVKVGSKKVYDPAKHEFEYRTLCSKELNKLINALPDIFNSFFDEFLESFKTEVTKSISEKKDLLKKEVEKKQSNQEIVNEIDMLQLQIKNIKPQIERLIELKENLS